MGRIPLGAVVIIFSIILVGLLIYAFGFGGWPKSSPGLVHEISSTTGGNQVTTTPTPEPSSTPTPSLTSPAPLEYDRFNNFNGQFSIDYPRGWDYSFIESSDPHFPPCTEFTGSIDGSFTWIKVYFDASNIYPDMFGVDYDTMVNDLLNGIPFTMIYNGHEYPLTELIKRDVTSVNNNIKYSVFRNWTFYIYCCEIDGGKIYIELQGDFNNLSWEDAKLAEICSHMVESLQVTGN